MKHLEKLHSYNDWGLLILRVVVGFIFVFHGVQKWGSWSAEDATAMTNLMRFLSIVEPLGGLALIGGFLTQYAAAGLGIIMIGAIYFKMSVWGIGFSSGTATGWEYDLVLLAANVALLFSGAGKMSVDCHWCMGTGMPKEQGGACGCSC